MVDVLTKVVEAAKNLLGFMNIQKLFILLITGLVAIALLITFERRVAYADAIAGIFKTEKSEYVLASLTMPTKDSLKSYVSSDPHIVAIQVLRTDFETMTRDTIFFHSKRRELQQDFETFHDNKKAPTPVFPQHDEQQQKRMVSMINQYFVCVPPTASIVNNVPSAAKHAALLCSVSIPPWYGKPIGYITLWLANPIEPDVADYYHSLVRQLSEEIYKKDVVRRP